MTDAVKALLDVAKQFTYPVVELQCDADIRRGKLMHAISAVESESAREEAVEARQASCAHGDVWSDASKTLRCTKYTDTFCRDCGKELRND